MIKPEEGTMGTADLWPRLTEAWVTWRPPTVSSV